MSVVGMAQLLAHRACPARRRRGIRIARCRVNSGPRLAVPALESVQERSKIDCEEFAMRDRIMQAVKDAMKSGEKARLSALRMVQAKIKDADIAARPAKDKISDGEIVDLMARMVKQRRESIELYKQGGRQELADAEQAEIKIIEEFMPKQLGDAEITAAIAGIVKDTGAVTVKDMGRVMSALKEKFAGQMDFAKASGIVKGLLK
jgi:uncharacterized protein